MPVLLETHELAAHRCLHRAPIIGDGGAEGKRREAELATAHAARDLVGREEARLQAVIDAHHHHGWQHIEATHERQWGQRRARRAAGRVATRVLNDVDLARERPERVERDGLVSEARWALHLCHAVHLVRPVNAERLGLPLDGINERLVPCV